jgi:membrane protein
MTGRSRLRLSSVFKQAFVAFRNDHASRFAAALAYYMIFSIVPMFLIAIAIAGMVFGKSSA